METIFFSSLPFRVEEKLLHDMCKPFGKVHDITIFADWQNPTHEPYAIVTLETLRSNELINKLDGTKIGRTFLRVHPYLGQAKKHSLKQA